MPRKKGKHIKKKNQKAKCKIVKVRYLKPKNEFKKKQRKLRESRLLSFIKI